MESGFDGRGNCHFGFPNHLNQLKMIFETGQLILIRVFIISSLSEVIDSQYLLYLLGNPFDYGSAKKSIVSKFLSILKYP
jgi:hypothetical protein